MRKLLLVGLAVFLVSPLSAMLGLSNAWGDAGDDAFAAFMLETHDSQALQLAQPAAEAGNFMAQFTLGRIFNEGQTQNKAEARKWFQKALTQARPEAERGDPRAQFVLGSLYAGGRGLPKDSVQAVAWLRKSAEQGDARAQFSLGQMYADGDSVSKDGGQALTWLRKGAEQGNANAQFGLAFLYRDGNGVSEDNAQAVVWFRKAAEQGFARAQVMLADCYLDGDTGVSMDKEQGLAWFRKAAEQGFANAQYRLGVIYSKGEIVDRDDGKAMEWFQKAAAQNFDPGTLAMVESSALWSEARAAILEQRRKKGDSAPKAVHSDVDKPGYTLPENPNKFAVIIGVEKYASLPVADFAERDAEAVRANLTALGYPARNIYFLSNQQATRAKIAQSVNTWLPKRVGENSTVFFYYSGHGAPDPQTNQAYLVPIDGDAEDLDSTAYPIKQLYAKLGKLKARHVIVALDSCFSGAGGRSVLPKGTRPLLNKVDLGALPDNVIALTASDKSEIAGTIEDQGHGAFTYYMLKGLAGAAKNASGAVTVQSLFDYLTPKVRDAARLHNRDQTPQILPAGGERSETRLR
jgi:TPR repeat protein